MGAGWPVHAAAGSLCYCASLLPMETNLHVIPGCRGRKRSWRDDRSDSSRSESGAGGRDRMKCNTMFFLAIYQERQRAALTAQLLHRTACRGRALVVRGAAAAAAARGPLCRRWRQVRGTGILACSPAVLCRGCYATLQMRPPAKTCTPFSPTCCALAPRPCRSRGGGGGGWRADDRRQRLLAMLEEGEDEDVDWDALAIKARGTDLAEC